MNLQSVFYIGFGGFIGTVARYLVGLSALSLGLPSLIATLAVNTMGSFAIGWVLSFGADRWSDSATSIVTIGVLGGFTTFSAFSADTLLLVQSDGIARALLYLAAMLTCGLLAVYLGFLLGSST